MDLYSSYTCNRFKCSYFFEGVEKTYDYNKEFVKKIQGYKEQDKKDNRPIDNKNEYVNVEWLNNNIYKCCGKCGCCLDSKNITAQRLNNDLAHYLNNIVPFCNYCNCSSK
jgi:hypothetical protein